MRCLVIKNTGSWANVLTPEGSVVSCKMRGKLRLRGSRSTTPLTVGDYVEVDEEGVISEVYPRRNCVTRRASNLSKESQVLAANVDYLGIVISIARPTTETVFIDRMTATAAAYGVSPLLIVNKTDDMDADERRYKDALLGLYACIGYECAQVSALTGDGVDELRERLRGKTTLLSGHSGVGKSTLINQLLQREVARTGTISTVHEAGKHTTTFSEMYELQGGGFIIDTPGIKGFGLVDIAHEEVGRYFPEIFKVSSSCRFGNCTHTHEPACAVRSAVERHEIATSRYESYLNMLQEDKKYR